MRVLIPFILILISISVLVFKPTFFSNDITIIQTNTKEKSSQFSHKKSPVLSKQLNAYHIRQKSPEPKMISSITPKLDTPLDLIATHTKYDQSPLESHALTKSILDKPTLSNSTALMKELIFTDELMNEIDQDFQHYTPQPQLTESAYWKTLYSIESKQGKLLYRPRNRSKSCKTTNSPCGHHQLSRQALKDIGCTSLKCKKNREDYQSSLAMSKKLQVINTRRMARNGYRKMAEYQNYLVHQQGATGARIIFDASKGKKLISKPIRRNMANNSPYSSKQYRKMGSKLAANIFLKHWESKWKTEKELIVSNNNRVAIHHPLALMNESELQFALNIDF